MGTCFKDREFHILARTLGYVNIISRLALRDLEQAITQTKESKNFRNVVAIVEGSKRDGPKRQAYQGGHAM